MQQIRLPDFVGVAANGTATLKIPKLAIALGGILLRLGGTTFTPAHIADIKVKIGSRVVWNVQTQGATSGGTHLLRMDRYRGIFDQASNLVIDFTDRDFKTLAAQEVGSYDLTKFAEDVFLEIQIVGATAPTLYAYMLSTPPQGEADDPRQLVQKLVAVPWAASAGGRFSIPFEPRGSIIKRAYLMYNGADGTATTDGSIQKVEVKKNGLTLFDPQDSDARYLQQRYRKVPQSKMFVIDFPFDNNLSGALPTADAASLELLLTLAGADNGIAYFEVLDTPFNL